MFSTLEPHTMPSLHEAASTGQLEMIANYIKEGADLNAKDSQGKQALMLAAFFDHMEVVKSLTVAGANINAVDDSGMSALMWAASNGNPGIIEVLIAAGAEVNASAADGATPLLIALKKGQQAAAKLLLAAGANKAVEDNEGMSALMYAEEQGFTDIVDAIKAAGITVMNLHQAAEAGNLAVVKYQIRHGQDYNEAIEWRHHWIGHSPIKIAAECNHASIVQYLLECGADLNVPHNSPALHCAKQVEIAKMLLDAGANIDAIDWDNDSALDCNIMRRNKMMVAFLLARGANIRKYSLRLASFYPDVDILSLLFAANPEKCNRHKDLMLSQVAEHGHQQVVQAALFLLEKGANINAAPLDGGERTILQCAAKSGNRALVEMLLAKGADSELPNRLDAPLVIAAGQLDGHLEVVELLLERGANVNARNEYGETALMRAVPLDCFGVIDDYHKHPRYKVFKTLLAHGAIIDSDDYEKKAEDGMDLIYPQFIPWLIHYYAWHKRRHALCFYQLRHNFMTVMGLIISGNTIAALAKLDSSLLKLNQQDRTSGNTLLHTAATQGDMAVMKALIDKGADCTIKNTAGKYAMDLLAEEKRLSMQRLLEEKLSSKESLGMMGP